MPMKTQHYRHHAPLGLALAGITASVLAPSPATASEGGASVYLLGSGGPGAAVLPPVEGIFFDNTYYYYNGEIAGERQLVGGNLVLGLEAEIVADFATVLWVPSTDLLGGTLAIGAALPLGRPDVNVSAVLTGPGGGQSSLARQDSATVVGDPIFTAMLGWEAAESFHVQAATMVNVPIGNYREGELANLAFHRWAFDGSLAATWRDAEAGWDVSGKLGVTFNGTNDFTDYKTGTEFHIEAAIERIFSPRFSAGLQVYHFEQLSGDSGAGAALGPNKGRVTGIGGTAAYTFTLIDTPVTARLRVFEEFDAKRRLEGTAVFFSLSFPLLVNLPANPAG
jgi:hypothetical protein